MIELGERMGIFCETSIWILVNDKTLYIYNVESKQIYLSQMLCKLDYSTYI